MAIHESGEDYLEAILMIKKRNGNVRSIFNFELSGEWTVA